MNYTPRINRRLNDTLKNVRCINCNVSGHVDRFCAEPITSFGMILTTKINESRYFFLVQRKKSIGFVDFVRGKYHTTDDKMILNYLEEMTVTERELLRTKDFETIWEDLWGMDDAKKIVYLKTYNEAKNKFLNNIIRVIDLLKTVPLVYTETEYLFPKGRRNLYESDLNCAIRECCEETGFNRKDFLLLRLPAVKESFIGSDGNYYKTVYYIGETKTTKIPVLDCSSSSQGGEIKNSGWFTYSECEGLLRRSEKCKRGIMLSLKNIEQKLS
jgi:8-oxo-dGTP pyrophosphatase MutT (NUDIX family)